MHTKLTPSLVHAYTHAADDYREQEGFILKRCLQRQERQNNQRQQDQRVKGDTTPTVIVSLYINGSTCCSTNDATYCKFFKDLVDSCKLKRHLGIRIARRHDASIVDSDQTTYFEAASKHLDMHDEVALGLRRAVRASAAYVLTFYRGVVNWSKPQGQNRGCKDSRSRSRSRSRDHTR